MEERQRRYGERYPIDEDLLHAIAAVPEASGVALGFDRLVMLASGAIRIDQVVWTPPAGDPWRRSIASQRSLCAPLSSSPLPASCWRPRWSLCKNRERG